MEKVFKMEKYVENVYDGDYEKAMKSFSVDEDERDMVFYCNNVKLEKCMEMGYEIRLDWCKLYAETQLDKEIITIINNYGFTDYSILYNYEGKPYMVSLIDDGEISGEKSFLNISSKIFGHSNLGIDEGSTIIWYIKKIQKLLCSKD